MPHRILPWTRRKYIEFNGGKLIVGALVAIGLMWTLLIYRAHLNTASDAKLCRKVDKVVNASIAVLTDIQDPATRNKYVSLFRAAACDPKNLPSAK